MHQNCALVFSRYAKPYFRPGLEVLEIAPDATPSTLETLVGIPGLSWRSAELKAGIGDDGRQLFAAGRARDMTFLMEDPCSIPAPAAAFDIVVAANVVEHVARSWAWIKELARVCKPSGHVILVAPVSWPEHKAPLDCWRIYPDGMKALAEEAALELELCRVDSLEPSISTRTYPGAGRLVHPRPPTWRERLSNLVFATVNWPRPVAHDIVAVMRKP